MITGASSGIGRETAIQFGERGAAVVLAARTEPALHEVAHEIERLGGRPRVVVTDVAEWAQVQRLAQEAVDHFGRIDTWVNDAAVSEWATVEQMTVEEIARVIQVDLMGPIYGIKAALPHMRRQGQGTIITIGSVESTVAVPLQASYVAAKHGLKGFVETLRMELEHERAGITVTLIMPASINTPLFTHARSKLGVMPRPIPPVWEPRVAAEAIIFAAGHARRTVPVGGAATVAGIGQSLSPSLLDRLMIAGGLIFKLQRSARPDDGQDNLFSPMPPDTYAVTGSFGAHSKSTSLYTRFFALHPNRERIAAGAALLGTVALVRRAGRSGKDGA